MPKSIETSRARRRREAVWGVAAFNLMQAACVICLSALCFIPDLPRWAVILFAVLAAIPVVPMVFSLVVLKQRFSEIEGGEQDAADQY